MARTNAEGWSADDDGTLYRPSAGGWFEPSPARPAGRGGRAEPLAGAAGSQAAATWAGSDHTGGRAVAGTNGQTVADPGRAANGHTDSQTAAGQTAAKPGWTASGHTSSRTATSQAAANAGWTADDTWAGWGEAEPVGEWAPRKPKRGRLLLGFALGAATVPAGPFRGNLLPPAPPTTAPAPPAAQPSNPAPPPPQAPGTVRLPAGGTATLVRTDLGAGGELPVPADLRQATWWGADLNAAGGASVFAGHVNWRGATGPFAELWSARIGGEVTIVDSAGRTRRYRVSQLVTVHKDDLPARADDLFGQSGPHRVVLVTCGGRWVGGSDGYEENRVVVADPE